MNELEAAIKRATYGRTFPKFSNTPAKIAAKADPAPPRPEYPKVIDIKRAVADYFSIEVHDLDCACRRVVATKPRQYAMYLCSRLTLHSLAEIGRRFGGRDHSTASHSVNKIERLISGNREWNREARQQVEEIKAAVLVRMRNGQEK